MESAQTVLVKGMVCSRCISTVSKALEKAGIPAEKITLGEVILPATAEASDLHFIESQLKPYGFSIVYQKEVCITSKLKQLVEKVYNGEYDFPEQFRFSELAEQELQADYKRLSTAFSVKEGITLEKFMLNYRVEKVKEWLVYTDKTLEDLAFRFGFSSTAHLSRQFRQFTGLNASHFRTIRKQKQLT
jgi:AraC-like DNA-binding protein